MEMLELLTKKRNGIALNREEIEFFAFGAADGSIPDYQLSAMLMAIYFRGMTDQETAWLTMAIANSGETADLSAIPGLKVDKHSTGGVGDKTTMMVAPIVAAAGVPVAKMSGKGLGFTCGTVDKLDAFPGMRTDLAVDEFIAAVQETGISVIGQSGNFAPADKVLYALRDVTATIESIPLIASSIMGKKIAAGADRILLDVKTGSGAFMKTYADSVRLAQAMVSIGKLAGRKTAAVISTMDSPLGSAVGNAIESVEAMEFLKGRGSEELNDFACKMAGFMLYLAERGTLEECEAQAHTLLASGQALEKFKAMLRRQGGDVRAVEDYSLLGTAARTVPVLAPCDGYITAMQTDAIGMVGLKLGAGRVNKTDPIDYTAGISVLAKTGDFVCKGDCLAELYTNRDEATAAAAVQDYLAALSIGANPPEPVKRILAFIDENGIIEF